MFKQNTGLALLVGFASLVIHLFAPVIAATISEEEAKKEYLGAQLKSVQTNMRTEVERLQSNAIKYNLYNEGVSDPDPASLIKKIHLDPTHQFCGATAEKKFNCLTENMLRQFSDVKVSNITSGTRYDGDRKYWAQIFLNNLVSPEPMSQFTPDSMTEENIAKPEFLKAYVKALGSQAMMSVGQQPFIEMMARRSLGSDQTSTNANQTMMDLMEEAASARFMNENWKNMMVGIKRGELQITQPAKPEVVMIDMAQMLAFQTWLQYQQYLQMENVQALLGALLIQNVRGMQAGQALLEKGSSVQVPGQTQ